MDKRTIQDVEKFWNENPLFTGEVDFDPNNPEAFFQSHDGAYFNDVLSGIDMETVFHLPKSEDKVLDLGCGIGFWSNLFVKRFGVKNIVSADLTEQALVICKLRVPEAVTQKENAESLTFDDNSFAHVNCQGVIHHTPNTQSCLNEIYRVMEKGGTASVSVYYQNVILRFSGHMIPFIKLLAKFLLKEKGRGRDFSTVNSLDDIVRYYDGSENPIGKAYTKREFNSMLKEAGFKGIQFQYYFFPFMIVANLTK